MKKMILIVIIVAAYVLIAFGMEYYVGNNIYLFMGKNVRFHYSNGTWTNDDNKSSYNKFQIYNIMNNKKIGTYDIKYDDGWYARSKGRYTSVEGVIMYKGKGKLNIISYEEKGKLDNGEVAKILKKFNLPTKNYNGYYIEIDVDNDGNKEKIYALKNYYSGMYFKETSYYSGIFIIKGSSIKEIVLDKSSKQLDYTNEITYIMDVDNDDMFEILISRSDIDIANKNINMKMYGLIDGEYVKLVGTE